MPTYTITTTPSQEALLSWLTTTWNTDHDTTFSNADYVTWGFTQSLASHEANYVRTVTAQVGARFFQVSPAVQNQVLTLLGVTP